MSSPVTRICFIRHGETDWNAEKRLQGHTDIELNARGRTQAAALPGAFADTPVDAVYSSDLKRARATAQPLADALGLDLRLRPVLRERNYGRCEGHTFAEIEVQFPDDAAAIRSRDPDYVSPGGESRRQHQKRVLDAVAGLVAEHPGQTLVVVTHGGFLDVIHRFWNGQPMTAPRDYPIPNGGLNWVSFADGRWTVECWGSTAHLES